jgi:outer membrane receptor protein involved in Fe transport
MKLALKALLFVMIVQWAWAQTPGRPMQTGDGKITGFVKDSTNNEAVEFANVALLEATGKPVNGDVCDPKGKFTISNVPDGNYTIAISFIGFKTKKIKVQITDQKNSINLGTISFSPAAEMLKEIEVQGQKVLVEEKVDRTIYNAENDATAKGGDATDVLRRVPMLSVDLDGNVSLRGSSNLKVLINGKPSTIAANSVADALKQIPSDQIKTVEVITSPSAKYDAEGSAGIINIITKKNTLEGATLNIDGSAGYRGSNLGLNGSYRKGKMGFSLGGFGRSSYNVPGNFYNDQISKLGSTSIIQTADTRNQNLFGNYTLGWDYDINKFNSLTASVRFGVRNGHNFQDNLSTSNFSNFNQTGSSLKNVDALNNASTMDASLNYTHTFEKQGREFSLLTLYSRNDGTNDFTNTFLDVNNYSITGYRKNTNKSLNQEATIQADYQTPIGQTQILEFGAKQIYRKVNSDYQYFNAAADGAYTPDLNPSLTNSLNYSQNITSGYSAYTLNASKTISIKGGVRYEYTSITANKQDGSDIPIPAYGVVVPSFNVSKRLSNGNTLKVAYNRRIQRPSIQFLNPNIQASNPLNITQGNPNLNPEYSNNYEISYSALIKSVTMNIATFYRNTDNAIQSVRDISGDTVRTTFRNIGLQDAYGMNLFLNINLSNRFSLNAGTDTYYAVLKNNTGDIYSASNSGWVSNFRLFGNYNFTNGWGLQFFGFYRGTQVQLQGYQGGFRMYSLSVKKDLANKKGSIGAGVENFFTPSMKIQNYNESSVLLQNNYNTMYNFSFKVTFSYRLGKMSMNNPPRKRKKSINNDDLKDGGDQSDAGTGGGQQAGGAPQGGGSQPVQGGGQRPSGGAPGQAVQGQPGQSPSQWQGLQNGQQKPQQDQPQPDNSKRKKKKDKKEEKKQDN